ncbi:MAG: hypothetical protein R2704_13555 [Microthrixaceae bacterium]
MPAKASPRAVACADEQRAGRGRLDRRWEARPGAALMLSVAHEAPSSPELLGALPLAMGLAALEAIADVLDGAEVEARLKWPNDLMVAGGGTPGAERGWLKAGGILGESFDDPRRGAATGRVAVLGIGINTAAGAAGGPAGGDLAEPAYRQGGGPAVARRLAARPLPTLVATAA